MLRIFGFYSFGKDHRDIIGRMVNNFEIKSKFTKFMRFNQGDIFIDYEMVDSDEAKNFYSVDKKNKLACFVVGNIHAYHQKRLQMLAGTNIARQIMDKYRKSGVGFAKFIRGIFNIAIIDKDKVFLINDNLGLSSMYVYRSDRGVFFCSSPEPIIWTNRNNIIDYGAIAEFIVRGFIPDERTFIKDLHNQQPATVIRLSKREVSAKRYVVFRPMNLKGMTNNQIIQGTRDIFNEAVKIRVNKGRVTSDLSGGWDTRFILANLLKLKEKPVLFTNKEKEEDFIIARMVAKSVGLEHIVIKSSKISPALREEFAFKFGLQKTIHDIFLQKDIFSKKMSKSMRFKLFISPRFSGIYGTELFGYLPPWFKERSSLDFNSFAAKIFTRGFMSSFSGGKRGNIHDAEVGNRAGNFVYSFLTRVGRTYLSTLYSNGWERPTSFFLHTYLTPFADSKFVSLLCALPYDKYLYYRLYRDIYRTYYPEFLNVPWTFIPNRPQYNLRANSPEVTIPGPGVLNKFIKSAKEEPGFRLFLKRNLIILKTESAILSRIKELYFLFKWFDTYRPVLNSSDAKFLSG